MKRREGQLDTLYHSFSPRGSMVLQILGWVGITVELLTEGEAERSLTMSMSGTCSGRK